MNIKHMLLYAVALLMPFFSYAQGTVFMEDEEENEISKTPVVAEAQIKSRLFNLAQEEANYYFRVNLQDNNFFVAEFSKISHWHGDGALKGVFETAANTTGAMLDSFKHATASKKLEIHMPISGEPLTVRTNEHFDNRYIIALNGRSQAQLKVGMDTITLLKTYREDKRKNGTELAQVKYSFILKNLQDIYNFSSNTTLIADIEHQLDSLVDCKRRQWTADDAWYHAMRAEYSPEEKDNKKRLKNEMTRTALSAVDLNASIGLTAIPNNIGANASVGLGYRWKTPYANRYNHVAASLEIISFPEMPMSNLKLYDVHFANLSYGIVFQSKNTLIPIDQVSLTVGYKVGNQPHPAFDKDMFKYAFNIGISNFLTISPEYYYRTDNYDFNDGYTAGFFALSLKIKLVSVINK
jgi:hypothetical protein